MKKNILLLGAHMSIADDIYKAIDRAESINCAALQLFTKSNRQWKSASLLQTDIYNFKQSVKNSSINSDNIFCHASYLINIASPNKDVEEKSIAALCDELIRCELLGISFLVLHPGSHVKTNEQLAIDRIIKNLAVIFHNVGNNVTILLETMAGQGSIIGYNFEQIGYILRALPQYAHKLAVCFDTCHTFAAGYNFTNEIGYKNVWNQFDKQIGIGKLKLFHINDSRGTLNSRLDRHANIGKGMIGYQAFKLLFNDVSFFTVPKILETPVENIQDYIDDMNTIKNLLSMETMEMLNVTR